MPYSGMCQYCNKRLIGKTKAARDQIVLNHESVCSPPPSASKGKNLKDALEDARRELGDW